MNLENFLRTSIINEIYRIMINQILQNPNIYCWLELDYKEILVYTSTVISYWGEK